MKPTILACLFVIGMLPALALAETPETDTANATSAANTEYERYVKSRREPVSSPKPLAISLSGRIGYHNWADSEESKIVKSSWGAQVEGRIGLGNTPLDFVVRGHVAIVDGKDVILYGSDSFPYEGMAVRQDAVLACKNVEQSAVGGSAQLQWNFARGAAFNPYVAAGAMHEITRFEADYVYLEENTMTYRSLSRTWHEEASGRIEEPEDGTAFVARAGLEGKPIPQIYIRLEASFLSKVYDEEEEKAQAELNTILGFEVAKDIRFDLAGTYFTNWKEYYITAGLTFASF